MKNPVILDRLVWCPYCQVHFQLLSIYRAAKVAYIDKRTIYRYIEEGKAHSVTIAGGCYTQKLLNMCCCIIWAVLCIAQPTPPVPNNRLNTPPENVSAKSVNSWPSLIQRGISAREKGDYTTALKYFAEARQLAQRLSDPTLEGLSLYQIGLSHTYQQQIDNAVQDYLAGCSLLKAAKANEHLVYVLADLGALYYYQRRYLEAKPYSQESLQTASQLPAATLKSSPRPDSLALALANLGGIARWEGNNSKSLEYLNRALQEYQEVARRDAYFGYHVAETHAEIGRTYRTDGNYVKALAAFNQALALARTFRDQGLYADTLNSVGLLYMEQRDYAQAGLHFRQSLAIHRAGKDELQICKELLNLGVTEYRQGHYQEALAALRESHAVSSRLDLTEGILAAGAVIGTVFRLQGQYATALQWLHKSLTLAEKQQDQTRLAEVLWQQGETFLAARQPKEALAAGTRALEIARKRHLTNLIYLAATMIGKAYRVLQENEKADTYFVQAINQIEDSRSHVAGGEQSSVAYFADKMEPYHQMVALLVEQGRPAQALLYAERAKGRMLLDVMRGGRNSLHKYLTTAERVELERLRGEIAQINERNSQPDAVARLAAARLAYEAYQNDLYAAHPEAKRQRGQTAPLTTDELAAMVPAGTAYLEYVVTPEYAFLFTILPSGNKTSLKVNVTRLNVSAAALNEQTGQLHDRVAGRSPLAPASARALYNALLAPAAQQLAGVESILIVPDGCLWNVPFQALLNGEGKYLLEDYAISYAPSLSVLREMKRKSAPSGAASNATLLAFGNPLLTVTATAAAPKDEDCPLPGAEQEVAALAALVGTNHSQVFTGGKASETAFRAAAANVRTLHFATHGILDNQHPLYSYLRLARTGAAPDGDGRLEAQEIMEMSLDADLAVLSACHTADGKISSGEGVIGMSWAFFVAGCRTTVVSQWAVNSEATSALIEHFYRGLANGQTKSQALRNASLAIRQETRYRHPFYWAGFVAIGSPD